MDIDIEEFRSIFSIEKDPNRPLTAQVRGMKSAAFAASTISGVLAHDR